jgi:hypothetical protein
MSKNSVLDDSQEFCRHSSRHDDRRKTTALSIAVLSGQSLYLLGELCQRLLIASLVSEQYLLNQILPPILLPNHKILNNYPAGLSDSPLLIKLRIFQPTYREAKRSSQSQQSKKSG